MSWLLEKFLGKNIDNYSIINKIDNKEVSKEDVIELIKQELVNSNVNIRKKTVDLLVKRDNEIIDLELNNTFDEDIRKRNFAYLSNIYSNLLNHNQNFDEQPNCTQINICKRINKNFEYDNYCLLGEQYKDKFIDNINFLVYDVAKYKKLLYTDNNKLIKKYSHIIMFGCDEKELELLGEYDEMVKEIGNMVKKYNDDNIFSFMTDEESYEKLRRAQLRTATRKATEKGMAKGIAKGMKEGMKEGIEQGIKYDKIQIAQNMLKEKFGVEIISKITGLSVNQINSIMI